MAPPSAAVPLWSSRWFRAWLLGVSCYFPVYWFSQFVLFALPALVRVKAFEYRLQYLQISPFMVIAVSARPETEGEAGPALSRTGGADVIETVLLVSALVAGLAIAGRRRRPASGFVIAMLGQVALARPLLGLLFERRSGAEVIVASVFFLAVVVCGLRWVLPTGVTQNFLTRFGSLFAAFTLPLALLGAVFALALRSWFPWVGALVMLAPGMIAASLASGWPVSVPERLPAQIGWRKIGCGIAATVLLAAGVTWGGRVATAAFEKSRRADADEAMALLPAIPRDLPYPKIFFQKGVTLTAEFPDVYASEGARRMLEALPRYGVNAVALVPYGFAARGQPRVRLLGADSWESDEGLEQLSRLAHARGIKVMLKPSLWLRDGFPGDLEFSSPDDRAKWFAEYRQFLEHYARLATRIHADIFCVGTELAKLTPHEDEWRQLIARVRAVYPGPLVYAANFGTEFETVKFWDALDYVGLQEYYPLPDNLATDAVVTKVEAVQRKFQRPVIFTEAGFSSYELPNREPWNDSTNGKVAPDAQARCYEAILRAFYHKPYFQGVYWWAVRTNGQGGLEDGSHSPWRKPAMQVLARWYSSPER
ncbi:MAG: hypothetical protein ACE145_06440 [Terriglobia bacterium]